MRNTLRKSEILRGHAVFADILKNGARVDGTYLQCYFRTRHPEGNSPRVKVGFAVPRKRVALAVDRNRIKRQLREVFRKSKLSLYTLANEKDLAIELVMMARISTGGGHIRIPYAVLETEWNTLSTKVISSL